MVKKSRKSFGPPIDLETRPTESQSGWFGIVLGLLAIGLIVAGTVHMRNVGGDGIETITERELVHAATVGGITRTENGDTQQTGDLTTKPTETKKGPGLKKTESQDFCPT